MTATTGACAVGPLTALPSLVDALVGAPLNGLDADALQEQIAAATPQVGRLQGWLQIAGGRLEQRTGGTLATDDGGRGRSVAGWLADVQHGTAGAAGSQPRTARLLRGLPLVVDAVLDGLLPRHRPRS